jgi:cysteine desulfurase/selenocysteine lyase
MTEIQYNKTMKSIVRLKKDFPIFSNNTGLIYLDSAATSQKPQSVIDAVSRFYSQTNSNVSRGLYDLSQEATDLYEAGRKAVAHFIGAKADSEVVFTANASESINYVALGYAKKHLRHGDVVVTSIMEHHSNFVPWLRLRDELGIELVVLPLTKEYRLDTDYFFSLNIPPDKVKLLTLVHASNVLGTVNPVKEIIHTFKSGGYDPKILIDAAQSVPHIKVDVWDLDCDFLAFSSHKMLGPSGVGVLWARSELLEDMEPVFTGSHMISMVTQDSYFLSDTPDRFEVGTGRLEGVAGLTVAIEYLNRVGMDTIESYENSLVEYSLKILREVEWVKLVGPHDSENRLAVFSLHSDRVHPHDVAEILNRKHIAVRAGHHCAQPLAHYCEVAGTTRASCYIYNSNDDIDALAEGLDEVKHVFRV